ncbi:ketopantoate reductase family protein [uncultured Jatrophihabitans sp.]|uniref:ketopantoate reductase family protein n=1 Tax=uncultured Jatrophihabitans sp. TaxID=1610747 RepID=UPI0035CABC08
MTLCLRRPRPELVVRTDGQELRPLVATITDPAEVADIDWVFLAVKAQQTPDTAPWLPALDRGASLVMMQNGVRLPSRVDGLWSGPTMPAVVYCPAEVVSPGVIEVRGRGYVHVQDDECGRALAAAFGPEQDEVVPVPDFARTAWEKLVSNAAVNSLTALTCRRVEVMREPGVAAIGQAIMAECAAVAAAEGVTTSVTIVDDTLARMQASPAGMGSSMYYDRVAGRELEHEALVGAVVSIGAEHGVPTPVSAMVLDLLRAVSGQPLPG